MHSQSFPNKLPRRWVLLILFLGVAVSLSLGMESRLNLALVRQLDNLFFDTLSKSSASGDAAQHALVIDVDDASLSAVGQWPWPRYRMAALVKTLADAKPAAIGLDIIFPEPDRTSLNNIQSTYRQDFGLDLTISGFPPELSDNDGYFGQVLGETGAVGGEYLFFDHENKTEVSTEPVFQIGGRTDLLSLSDASGILTNTFKIATQLKFSGFLNNKPDDDGMMRGLPLLIRHNGQIHPHLSLAAYMRSMSVTLASIETDAHGPLIRVGKHAIPIDRQGYALLRFSGKPHLYPALSAVDILRGAFRSEDLKGKILFVGSSAAGLNDLHSTIFDAQFPGLKTQAVMAENMATDNYFRNPDWAKSAILWLCLAVGILISALFVFLRGPLQLFLGTLATAGVVLLICVSLFRFSGLVVSPAAPMLVSIILFTLFTVARLAIEKRNAYLWFKELANAQQVTIESMSAVAETRDPETGAHIKRVQHYVKAIAEHLRESGYYSDLLTQEYIDLLFVSAPLHDIGKVGVPDNILRKPGILTDEEFVLMKKHAEFGRTIIHNTAKKIVGENFLIMAGEIAATHHEKWDGTGYPLGLAGQAIPLCGRITMVADVYDALITRRCYKPPYSHEASIQTMLEARGQAFDPVVLDSFLSIEETIKKIAARYQDEHELILGDM